MDNCEIYQQKYRKLKIENITVIKPPLLKIYYWNAFDIEGFNEKLRSNNHVIEHNFICPTRQLNSTPFKIIFWLRNLSREEVIIRPKRIQNCQCLPMKTQVGFNTFRTMYHCPHRRLINILEGVYTIEPKGLMPMTVSAQYYLFGEYVLTYELNSCSMQTIMLHFHVNIVTFDTRKAILTHELIPVDIEEHRRLAQPVWIRNITLQNLKFIFSIKDRGVRLLNPCMIVPRQSVWPLIVEYRPTDFENELELVINLDGMPKTVVPLTCKGYLKEESNTNPKNAPIYDYACTDYSYIVYPNKLEFETEINEEHTQIVAVHNNGQQRMQFKWQTYSIADYMSFHFEPSEFCLKPQHSKLTIVRAKSYRRPLHFRHIPAVLEIHRILDKSTRIAKEILSEIESIDDPKWKEDSYVEHVFLQIDFNIKVPRIKQFDPFTRNFIQHIPAILPLKDSKLLSFDNTSNSITSPSTIFEKLFWDYLSQSNYMRDTSKMSKNLTYGQVCNEYARESEDFSEKSPKIYKMSTLNMITSILAKSCIELSKNYCFISEEQLEQI